MGRLTVKVPDVGEGVAEVELVSWAIEEGQVVERNQVVAEVMTDKATVEVPSPVTGVMRDRAGGPGDRLLVGETLFVLEVDGEGDSEIDAPADASGAAATTSTNAPADTSGNADTPPIGASGDASGATATPPAIAPAGASSAARGPAPGSDAPADAPSPAPIRRWSPAAPRPEGRKPTATPSVRRRARESGVDLRAVTGSGPAGRITHDDLDQLFRLPGGRPTIPDRTFGGGSRRPDPSTDDQPIIGLRRRIAEQVVASCSTIPHITYVEEVDMTALEQLRSTLNERAGTSGTNATAEGTVRLTILPFLVRALVRVLPEFPMCNAHVIEGSTTGDDDRPDVLRTFGAVHVGIATQTDGGLVVPVLRHAEAESLWSTATRLTELAEVTRSGRATAADLMGSTITVTSLGALGGLVTTPVINKPETTIVGVNKLVTRPVWDGEQFVPRQMMNLSSSFDHRVVDGWDAASFVQAVRGLLEQPALLFVDDV